MSRRTLSSGRSQWNQSSRRDAAIRRAAKCEPLERRQMLCSFALAPLISDIAPQYEGKAGAGPEADTGGIVWSNRGTTDNFNSTYGTRAAAAREVVDAAFYFWNQVIPSLNQDGGNSQIDISVTAMAKGTGWGGSGGVDTLLGNKPRTSSISLGGGADTVLDTNTTVEDGEGFYIDPTPYDFSEFQGNIVNAFTGGATAGGPADNLNDLFSLVTIEIQHALGIEDRYTNLAWRSDPNNYLSPAGSSHANAANDGADTPGKLYYLNAPGIQALFTSNNGGSGGQDRGYAVHTARPSQSYTTGGVTYTGQLDTGTTGYLLATRYLPSYVGVQALGVMYGYTVNPPQDVGQTFYAIPDRAARQVIVRNPDPTSSDRMEMRSASGGIFITLDIGNDVAGTNMGGAFVVQFSRLAFDTVVMDGGGGTDFMRVDGNDFSPVTLRGGAGDDFLDLGFVQRNLDLINGAVLADGGTGYDRIFIYDNLDASGDTFTFSTSGTDGTFDVSGNFNFLTYRNAEEANPTTGTGTDTVDIFGTPVGTKLFINSAGGTEIVNVGKGIAGVGAQNIRGDIDIRNSPSFTTVNINDAGNSVPRNVVSGDVSDPSGLFGYVVGLTGGGVYYKYADTSSINVTMGGGADVTRVHQTNKPIGFFNTGGGDAFYIGNQDFGIGTNQIFANITINNADFVFSDLFIENFLGQGRTMAVNKLANSFFSLTGGTGGGTITWRLIDQTSILGSRFGNDTLTMTNIDDNYITFNGGGEGFDNLIVDDRGTSAGFYLNELRADGIDRWTNPGVFAFPISVNFASLDSFTHFSWAGAISTNIYGTPTGIPAGQQATLFLGGFADTVHLYPHNTAGNLTINSNIGIVGGTGTDMFRVIDTGNANAIDYAFSNPFGSGTQNVFGLGTGGVGTAEIENWEVLAGDGNDTFAMNQWTSGRSLGIYGGGGDDVVDFGNGNLPANITSISAFGFDGQGGYDTFNMLNHFNDALSGWSYTQNVSSLVANRTFGGTGYFLTLSMANNESIEIEGTTGSDIATITNIPVGMTFDFKGFEGSDALNLPPDGVTNVRGPIIYDGGTGSNNLNQISNTVTADTTVHIMPNTLGAVPGDNFFGSGGSLAFANVTNAILTLGSGSDTVYAHPNPTAALNIRGGNPTVAPGDTLNLALAAVTNYSINPTSATDGTVTSADHATLTYSNFETGPIVDDVAPSVATFGIELDRPVLSITHTFDEALQENFGLGFVLLTDLDTNEPVPFANMQVNYEPGTNTVVHTFPGFANGLLPDGNYRVDLSVGLNDFFGNQSVTPVSFDTFFLNGDANHDRAVNLDDFTALAAGFGEAGLFSQGDFNYSGNVDLDDFTLLAGQFGTTLAEAPPARSAGSRAAGVFGERIIGEALIDELV